MTLPYEPTPDEIRLECEAIRRTWPEARRKRQECYHELESIPEVERITDHMVRREERGRV